MTPEYKLYHGSVLAEIVDSCRDGVMIASYGVSGRLLSYILDGHVAFQIKYATQQLRPWHFSFTAVHVAALAEIETSGKEAFLVLVCRMDGFVVLPADVARHSLQCAGGDQAWLRADRRRREHYRVFGPGGEFKSRYPGGLAPLVEAVNCRRKKSG